MTKKEKRQLVEDVLSEVFAIDGRLKVIHEVYLRPYDVTRIKQSVREDLNQDYDLDYPDEALRIETRPEFYERIADAVLMSGKMVRR